MHRSGSVQSVGAERVAWIAIYVWIASLALAGTPAIAQESQPPPPTPPAPTGVHKVASAPEGYRWQKLTEALDARFLLPLDWVFHHVESAEGSAYFLTREDPAMGPFVTGLTVNLVPGDRVSIRQPPESPIRDAVGLARSTVDDLASRSESLRRWDVDTGPFQGPGALLKFYGSADKVTRVYILALANRRTGSLSVIRFESPDAEWDDAWKKGVVMLDHFVLDDDF